MTINSTKKKNYIYLILINLNVIVQPCKSLCTVFKNKLNFITKSFQTFGIESVSEDGRVLSLCACTFWVKSFNAN